MSNRHFPFKLPLVDFFPHTIRVFDKLRKSIARLFVFRLAVGGLYPKAILLTISLERSVYSETTKYTQVYCEFIRTSRDSNAAASVYRNILFIYSPKTQSKYQKRKYKNSKSFCTSQDLAKNKRKKNNYKNKKQETHYSLELDQFNTARARHVRYSRIYSRM